MNTINIISADSQPLTLSIKAANSSAFFKGLLGEQPEDLTEEIPVPYPADVLRKVFDFMEHHVVTPMAAIQAPVSDDFEKDLSEYDRNLIQGNPMSTLMSMLEVANYLTVEPLLDLLSAHIAKGILATEGDKQRFETTFNLKTDLTKEEEEHIEAEFNKFYKN